MIHKSRRIAPDVMSNKSFPRSRRVAQLAQQVLSELIRRELHDPRLGMLTLTEVRMSKDLGYATIYFSVLGADPATAREILNSAAGMLRGPLGRALGIRHSPELRFVHDELIEGGARLAALIRQAVDDDEARQAGSPPEPAAAPPAKEGGLDATAQGGATVDGGPC